MYGGLTRAVSAISLPQLEQLQVVSTEELTKKIMGDLEKMGKGDAAAGVRKCHHENGGGRVRG